VMLTPAMIERYQEIVRDVGTTTSRTVGIEMEGLFDTNIVRYRSDMTLPNGAIAKDDGSLPLYNGVEFNSAPMYDLSGICDLYKAMKGYGFRYTHNAGTHIHVDISDFTCAAVVRLAWFCSRVQYILYASQMDYRLDHDYVHVMDRWRDYAEMRVPDDGWGSEKFGYNFWSAPICFPRFGWCRPREEYGTVEMRLFNWIGDADEAIAFMKLAHNIVQLIKDSTVEHLNFIVNHVYSASTAQEAYGRFFEQMGMPVYPIRGQDAMDRLECSLNIHHRTSMAI